MPGTKNRLLVVDDESAIRTTLLRVFSERGYKVRVAEDGFSALSEIKDEIPDILLSDLNMPKMSGFELLSVVGQRFPAIRTVAMSGTFSGNEVPSGVTADAFFQKGSSIVSLMRIMDELPRTERMSLEEADPSDPVWIHKIECDSHGEAIVAITCPACLRTFPRSLSSSICTIRTADCIHCHSSVRYALVHPGDRPQHPASQGAAADASGARLNLPQLFY